jgi:hypothetical protein
VADHLHETHFSGFQPIMENRVRTFPVRASIEKDWLVASDAVDSNKIRWAIEGFGSFKFAGEDGIFPALLKNGIEILSGTLIKIFTGAHRMNWLGHFDQ